MPAIRGLRSAAICRRDFGFAIDVHAHEPGDGVRWWRSRATPSTTRLTVSFGCTAVEAVAMSGSALTKGCRKATVKVDVLRDAMSVDSLDRCGLYFGTTGRSRSTRRTTKVKWEAIVRDLPAVLSVEVQTLA